MFRKIIYLFILTVLLSGCATTKKYEALLNTWMGDSEESLIRSWGAPQSSYQMENGKKAVGYSYRKTIVSGGYSYVTSETVYDQSSCGAHGSCWPATEYVTQTTPVSSTDYWCDTTFFIGVDGRIEGWHWQGNNCVSYYESKQ